MFGLTNFTKAIGLFHIKLGVKSVKVLGKEFQDRVLVDRSMHLNKWCSAWKDNYISTCTFNPLNQVLLQVKLTVGISYYNNEVSRMLVIPITLFGITLAALEKSCLFLFKLRKKKKKITEEASTQITFSTNGNLFIKANNFRPYWNPPEMGPHLYNGQQILPMGAAVVALFQRSSFQRTLTSKSFPAHHQIK